MIKVNDGLHLLEIRIEVMVFNGYFLIKKFVYKYIIF